jgi:DNA-binding NarL/FixJ family response regulator
VNEERRCLIIDAHPAVRAGVRGLLGDEYEVEEATDGKDALEILTSLGEFDVAIVELCQGHGDGPSGISSIRALRKARPGLGIVAHASRPEHHAANAAIDAGATAFVAKRSPADALRRAVEAAAASEQFVDPAARNGRGPHAITRRQREILQLFADGNSTAEVSAQLGLSTETVRTHTKALLTRLSAHDRAHAVAIGMRTALID